MLTETMLTVCVYEGGQVQSDKFFAGVAVHLACRRIRFQHEARFQIGDDQPVADGIENALILPFFFFGWRLVRVLAHNRYLLLSSIA